VKLFAPTIDGAKAAVRARKTIGGRIPQPVDDTGRTPALWADCTAYVVDDDPKATVDDQDLIAAIAAAPGKLRADDDTPAKIKTRLAADITKAKGDREAGKKIGRDKPTGRGDEPGKGGGKTKAGK
jgi:hypothetical protein